MRRRSRRADSARDVDTGERDRRGKQDRETARGAGTRATGLWRRRSSWPHGRGKRSVVRHRYERLRLRVAERRPRPVDRALERCRRPVCDGDCEHGQEERPQRPPQHARARAPARSRRVRAGPRTTALRTPGRATRRGDERKAVEMAIGRDQAGTICFVCSISARRSKGLPTKPCARAGSLDAGVELPAEHHDRNRSDAVAFLNAPQHLQRRTAHP